ncbi:glycosyltransferase family 2 protein [uncultured Methanobrevibacter sp.]|uniref:glycosyltransferase family 2 protein n=1 Tax=uncultured Methanobrevibacter sp. TaxID=253161 RepID=UPI0025DBF423|nr:glycosyltransferase family 2 protein [uncultured Methanobrevibacter sp.]
MAYKISIIIPVYNAADFIVEKALKSIENQTMNFNDIEVVLVNDCSTDNTEKILNEYAIKHDNILPIHLRNNNGGPAIPRNIGITYASADYLMFLDQDDTFKTNACEVLYNKITENDVDMVCGNFMMVSNGHSQKCFDFNWTESPEIKINKIDENPNVLTMGVAAWSKIFRKSFVIENNLKFTEGIGEDIYFSIRGLLNAKGIILLKDFIVVDYNIRTESLSHQVDKDYMLEFADFYLNFLEYCFENVNPDFYQPLLNSRMNNILSSLFYSNLYFYELSEVFIKIKEMFIKLHEKSFTFYNKTYQLLSNSLINDEYPFENSIITYSSIKGMREKKFDNGIKYLKQNCKLYVDCGKGFNEKDSITIPYFIEDTNEISFDLTNFNDIKRLRFDPISWFFIKCEIKNIKSNIDDLVIRAVNTIDNHLEEDIFITYDPQYHILGNLNDIDYLNISFKIELLNNSQITKIIEN